MYAKTEYQKVRQDKVPELVTSVKYQASRPHEKRGEEGFETSAEEERQRELVVGRGRGRSSGEQEYWGSATEPSTTIIMS